MPVLEHGAHQQGIAFLPSDPLILPSYCMCLRFAWPSRRGNGDTAGFGLCVKMFTVMETQLVSGKHTIQVEET